MNGLTRRSFLTVLGAAPIAAMLPWRIPQLITVAATVNYDGITSILMSVDGNSISTTYSPAVPIKYNDRIAIQVKNGIPSLIVNSVKWEK